MPRALAHANFIDPGAEGLRGSFENEGAHYPCNWLAQRCDKDSAGLCEPRDVQHIGLLDEGSEAVVADLLNSEPMSHGRAARFPVICFVIYLEHTQKG